LETTLDRVRKYKYGTTSLRPVRAVKTKLIGATGKTTLASPRRTMA
jgi:hypothetical protein